MRNDEKREIQDGFLAFESTTYGNHVLSNIDRLIEDQISRIFTAQSWEEFQEYKAKKEAYERAKNILMLVTDFN